MQIKVLGCSGGIGLGLRTTSMLIDDDILIDAGSGVGDLTMDQLLLIDHAEAYPQANRAQRKQQPQPPGSKAQ